MKFHKNFRFQFFFVKSLEIESENSLSKRFDYNGYITEYCLTDLTVIRPVNHRGYCRLSFPPGRLGRLFCETSLAARRGENRQYSKIADYKSSLLRRKYPPHTVHMHGSRNESITED